MKKLSLLFIVTLFVNIAIGQVILNDSDSRPLYQSERIYAKLEDKSDLNLMSFPKISDDYIAELIRKYGITKIELPFAALKSPKLQRTYRFTFTDNGSNIDEFVKDLAASEHVEYAEKIPMDYTQVIPNDPLLGTNQYYWNMINGDDASNIIQTAPGAAGNTVVAIVDDAVQTSHEDLAANIFSSNWDAADLDSDPNPPFSGSNAASPTHFSHGTHVAGIAGAHTNNGLGVASIGWSNNLMCVKTASNAGSPGSLPAAYDGVVWAAANGAQVINMSWGSAASSLTNYNIIEAAYNQDIVMIAAAGNSATINAFYPAAYGEGATGQTWEQLNRKMVISVASLDQNNDMSVWGTSGFGGTSGSNYGHWVDISAYGTAIHSSVAGSSGGASFNSNYGTYNGTSMAAPMVSGVAGMMRTHSSTSTADQIYDCLVYSANPDIYNAALHPDNVTGTLGEGRLDAEAALQCISSNCSDNPIAVIVPDSPTLCPGDSVILTASAGVSYSWSPNGETTQSIVVTSPGTYTVDVTFAGGCSDVASYTVQMADTEAHIVVTENSGNDPNDGVLCGQGMLQLSSYYGLSYQWSAFGATTPAIPGTINFGTSIPATWVVWVEITGVGGCPGVVDTAFDTIQWLLPPTVTVLATEDTICSGDSTTLTASGADFYDWTPATGLSATTGASVNASPSSTTTYTVTGTDQYGCSETTTITVFVDDSCSSPCSTTAGFMTFQSGLNTSFFNSSTAVSPYVMSYSWDFGDGNTSTATSPSHSYATTGTYVVTLTVTASFNGDTCTDVAMDTVTVDVNCATPPDFTFNNTNGCTVDFTNTTVIAPGLTLISTEWDFGDGNTSTANNPSHTYGPGSTTYLVCLKVTVANSIGDTCSDEICKKVDVKCADPCEISPNFTYSIDSTSCTTLDFVNTSVLASGNTITSFTWYFGDGSTNTTSLNPTHAYASTGTYNVCLVINAVNQSGDSCVNKVCYKVEVKCDPCNFTPDFTFNTNANCIVDFTNTSILGAGVSVDFTYWSIDGGAYVNTTNPSYFLTPGTHSVCLVVVTSNANGDQCKDQICKKITVNCTPTPCSFTADFTASNSGLCTKSFTNTTVIPAGYSVNSVSWDFGDGSTNATTWNASHTYASPAIYTVCLAIEMQDSLGQVCTDTICKNIKVKCFIGGPCNVNALFNHIGLIGSKTRTFNASASTTMFGTTITQYQWDFDNDGVYEVSTTNPVYTHTFPTFGTFPVCLKVIGQNGFIGCFDTECKNVKIKKIKFVLGPKFKVSPNPSRGMTNILLELEEGTPWATVDVYNAQGTKIKNLHEGPLEIGKTRLQWNARDSETNGTYFIRYQSEEKSITERVILTR